MKIKIYTIKVILLAIFAILIYYLIDMGLFLLYNKYSYLESILNTIRIFVKTSIVIIVGYIIISIIKKYIILDILPKIPQHLTSLVKLVSDVILYSIYITAILLSLGLKISDALLGGTIGGIILGLALQSSLQHFFAGLLLTASESLSPGDIVIIHNAFSGVRVLPYVGEVRKVDIINTSIKTIYGTKFLFPNNYLLNNVVIHKVRKSGEYMIYTMETSINADVDATKVIELSDKLFDKYLSHEDIPKPQIYFLEKRGNINVLLIVIQFKTIERLDEIIDEVNKAIEEAYWSVKSQNNQNKT